ncbi:MAG: TIGR00730 family Rossman fold protein [Burkholderiales bacterium]
MNQTPRRPDRAYRNEEFLNSKDARALRILAEYLEPRSRFEREKIEDTIVFMGSARFVSQDDAQAALNWAKAGEGDLARAETLLRNAVYYEAARELARRLTLWSKALDSKDCRFVVCTGGGPGIMEAANRGAAEARGINVGLGISLPNEQHDNPYITHELAFHFHYFFMRKFWFAYLAKAVILFPGGFGTMDELFELLTLVQTRKMKKPLPILLFGTAFWSEAINFDALVRHGTISATDVELVHRTDSVDEAYTWLTGQLASFAVDRPGAML